MTDKLIIQVNDEVREMTANEVSAHQEQLAIIEAQKLAENAQIAARQSALAKLAALGLTENEIAAL